MHVIIVGAGPSGLVLALLLAKANIRTTLLDSASTIDDRPRAAHYAPSAIQVMARAGVLEDIRRDGFIPMNMMWRNVKGEPITGIPKVSQPWSPEAMTVLPLNMLGKVLLEHCEKEERIEIKWNCKVVSVGSDAGKAWAVAEVGREFEKREERYEGDYICGCDGANSQVRRTLFGNEFPGNTWDAQIIATNVYYPFEKFGYDDINFIIDNEDYYMAAKITNDGLWRVSYGEDTKHTLDQVVANQPAKYERMLPGHPKPGDYKLLNVGPYRIHQRCAPSFRVGRILLAADAAHLCNPFGGLGLTGGLVDVGGLAECLEGMEKGVADESILNKYDEIRRQMWHDVINPVSSSNFLRVSATDPETATVKDEFLKMVDEASRDQKVRDELDKAMYAICHDFKQYWKTPGNRVEAKL
ncbi:FAD/NAD(P)-binding domain-containing protein [Mollisia scopiformis]|uniref:FAD/NAD(P)-binding domain-containing protein n=1 Tax=Mollisia scopiformis TaxID=149040 RepID=A0A132BAM6_MOLSC|nr:FAD/NAD(P)-binding domain-containing protein [Mollisia scopiformis]KUJ09441.1 FAD/NAD(P)-binding domain-containing protein [Mollisia scopiformis]